MRRLALMVCFTASFVLLAYTDATAHSSTCSGCCACAQAPCPECNGAGHAHCLGGAGTGGFLFCGANGVENQCIHATEVCAIPPGPQATLSPGNSYNQSPTTPVRISWGTVSSVRRPRVVWAVSPQAPRDSPAPAADTSPKKDRPIVKLVSPAQGGANVMPGGEATLLVVVEVVDVAGFGISSDDSGVPRFLDDDPNIRLFVRNLIAQHRYTDSRNQEVIQLVSEVPAAKLVPEKGSRMTAPLDWKRIPRAWLERGFRMPPEASIEYAAFTFRVKDARGVPSEDDKPDYPTLVVGFATSAYVPEGTPPPEGTPSKEDKPDTP